MPMAIVVFALPSEQEEYAEMLRGPDYRRALGDVWQQVRSKLKYEELPEGHGEAYEQVREWIARVCEEYDVEVP